MCKKLILSICLLGLNASVFAACSFQSSQDITFACAPTSASGCLDTNTFSVRCTSTTSATLTLSTGQSNTYSPRQMRDTTQNLNLDYNVYLDANQSQIFGDGSQGTYTMLKSIPRFNTQTYTLYSYVLSSTVLAGTYTDSLILSMNY